MKEYTKEIYYRTEVQNTVRLWLKRINTIYNKNTNTNYNNCQ